MTSIESLTNFLEEFAPCCLAEDWDNVGLLVGDPAGEVDRVMTCLTVTPVTAEEAIERQTDLIVTHHPMPFHPIDRLTTETTVGRLLWDLIAARVAVYSPHTAFDSAADGINQHLATGLHLREIAPLVPREGQPGAGRWGSLEEPVRLEQLAARVKDFLAVERLQVVGKLDRPVRTVAVACGAAGEFLRSAAEHGCDAMLLGETNFHTCLEAEALGIGLLLPGHFASERFAVESMAELIAEQFSDLEVWLSRNERDPLCWV